jgi:aspartate kinase
VALAATVEAAACEILTDVAGVFTADPRVVPDARLIPEIAYDQMISLAHAGAGVLMAHSVETAREHRVPVHVRSSFTDEEGSWVRPESAALPFAGLAHKSESDRGLVTVVGTDAPSVGDEHVEALRVAGIDAHLSGTDEGSATYSMPSEQTGDAMRFLHTRLFQLEASK